MLFSLTLHGKTCDKSLVCHISINKAFLNKPIKELAETVQAKSSSDSRDAQLKPLDILRAYGKKSLLAHRERNCLTKAIIDAAEKWALAENVLQQRGSLDWRTLPTLLEDLLGVKGHCLP